MQNKLTIYIPTKNRHQFLNRCLKYYDETSFEEIILIGDSSNKEEQNLNKEVIANYPNLNIDYYHFKLPNDHHDAAKTVRLLDKIKTPYITFCGDDDFQLVNGLRECVNFLEQNPDYVAAHGHRINFTLDDIVYGNVIALDMYPGYDWTDEPNPINRWIEYLRCGIATTYYVHRTKNWKQYYKHSDKAKSHYIGNELIPCSICVLLGKVKRLEVLTTAFQRDNPIREFSFVKTTLWDLINGPHWADSVRLFEEAVLNILTTQVKIETEQAKEIFYREFWTHCLSIMIAQYNSKFSERKEEQIETTIVRNITKEHDLFPIYKIVRGSGLDRLYEYLEQIQDLDIREGSTDSDFEMLMYLADKVKRPGMVAAEVGCWKGATTGALGQVIKENGGILWCCDPWENETCSADHTDILEIFEKNIQALELTDNIVILRKPSREAYKQFPDDSLDIVFLDGLHMYDYFYKDLINFYPKIRTGGIIAGHDCNLRFEQQNKEVQEEIKKNKDINCVALETLDGKKVHCGVAFGLFQYFGADYQTSSDPMCSIWYHIKK